MKSVSGNIVSSKPVSLSKASKILSNFISFENGASQAVSVYLRRAAASFADLNQFHKDLNSSSFSHKNDKDSQIFVYGGEDGTEINEDVTNEDLERKEKKKEKEKKKKKKKSDDVEADSGSSLGIQLEKSKEKKKRKEREIDDEAALELAEQSGEKKKKKKKKRRKLEGNL